jgi:glucose-1-phosphatase
MLFIFDMGGVVTNSAAIEKKICSILGISEKEFYEFCGCPDGNAGYGDPLLEKKAFDPYTSDLLTLLSNGTITTKQFWQEFSVRAGKVVRTDYWHLFFHPVRNEQVCELVRKLHSKYRVVCGTNTIESHYMTHIERGDYTLFDQTYASCMVGVSKPDPEFWKMILLGEHCDPGEAVFIDDNTDNCSAAGKVGIRTIKFTNADALFAALVPWL